MVLFNAQIHILQIVLLYLIFFPQLKSDNLMFKFIILKRKKMLYQSNKGDELFVKTLNWAVMWIGIHNFVSDNIKLIHHFTLTL